MSTKQPNEFSSAERAQLMSFLHGTFVKTGTTLEKTLSLATKYEARDKVVETTRHMEKSNSGHRALRITLRNVTGLQSANGVKCVGKFQRAAETCGFIVRPQISMRKIEIEDGKRTLQVNDLTFHVHRKAADTAASFSVTSKDEPAPKPEVQVESEAYGHRLNRNDIEDVKRHLRFILPVDQGYTVAHNRGFILLRINGFAGDAEQSHARTQELVAGLVEAGFVAKGLKPEHDVYRGSRPDSPRLRIQVSARKGYSLDDVVLLPMNETRTALAVELIERALSDVLTKTRIEAEVNSRWGAVTAEYSVFVRASSPHESGAGVIIKRALDAWRAGGFEAVHIHTHRQSRTTVRLDFELRSMSTSNKGKRPDIVPSPIKHPALEQVVPMMTAVLVAVTPVGPHVKVLVTGNTAAPATKPAEVEYYGIRLSQGTPVGKSANEKDSRTLGEVTFDACQIRQLLVKPEEAIEAIAEAIENV